MPADRTLDRPHPRSPARLPLPSLGGRPRSAGFHRPLHARSSCTRRLQPVIGHVRRVPRSAPQRAERLQGCGGHGGGSIPVPTRPAEKSGQRRWRERAARPLPRGSSATVGCGRRLCCIGGCAFRSAQPSSDLEPARAALPSPPPLPPPRGQLPRATRTFDPLFPGLRISEGEEFRLGPCECLSACLPLPSRLPLLVGARAHARSHTHTHTRRRACAGPRALSRGVSSASQQIPLSPAPLLTQASSRHWASSVCGSAAEAAVGKVAAARRGLRAPCPGPSPGRSGEGGRRGEEEPRRARVRAAGCLRYRYRSPR